jgi:hypothetical protein
MPGIVYDTGALLAAERRDVTMSLLHQQAVRSGARPIVPAVVLAQAWRGGPQHGLSLMLKSCLILPTDEHLARAVTAAALNATIMTSDPDDLNHLADAITAKLTIRQI